MLGLKIVGLIDPGRFRILLAVDKWGRPHRDVFDDLHRVFMGVWSPGKAFSLGRTERVEVERQMLFICDHLFLKQSLVWV